MENKKYKIIAESHHEDIDDYKSKYDYTIKVSNIACLFNEGEYYFDYEIWDEKKKLVAKGIESITDDSIQLDTNHQWIQIEDKQLEDKLLTHMYNYFPNYFDKPSLASMGRLIPYLYKEMNDSDEGMKFLEMNEWKKFVDEDRFTLLNLLDLENIVWNHDWQNSIEIDAEYDFDIDNPVITCYGDFRTLFDESEMFTLENLMKFDPLNRNLESYHDQGYITDDEVILLKDNELKVKEFMKYVNSRSEPQVEYRKDQFVEKINWIVIHTFDNFDDLLDFYKDGIRRNLDSKELSVSDAISMGCEKFLTPMHRFSHWYEEHNQVQLSDIFKPIFFSSYLKEEKTKEIIESFLERAYDEKFHLSEEDKEFLSELLDELSPNEQRMEGMKM
ncbi:MAG: hypothetical protein RR700_06390 [Anaerorhabdus sp.]|uniref:hypothetical protein n=1 Tax=Anaerorhabdus sp. TaxID=1872524 RepID=UPI002FC64A5F